MSGEHIAAGTTYRKEESITGSKSKKVDINILLNKVRKEKKKEKIEGYIFVGLISSIILVGGIIISL